MTTTRPRGLTQKGEVQICDLLYLRLLDSVSSTSAVRAAVRSPWGDYTMRTWSFPTGHLSLALVHEICRTLPELVEEALVKVVGIQDPLVGE